MSGSSISTSAFLLYRRYILDIPFYYSTFSTVNLFKDLDYINNILYVLCTVQTLYHTLYFVLYFVFFVFCFSPLALPSLFVVPVVAPRILVVYLFPVITHRNFRLAKSGLFAFPE
jgi:hypothetical protein